MGLRLVKLAGGRGNGELRLGADEHNDATEILIRRNDELEQRTAARHFSISQSKVKIRSLSLVTGTQASWKRARQA